MDLQFSKLIKKITITKALIVFIMGDIIMLLLHLGFADNYFLFHLDHEQNIPTVYQGTKLLIGAFLVGMHLFLIFSLKDKSLKQSITWIILFMLLFFLGIDEIGQLHEGLELHLNQMLSVTSDIQEELTDLGYKSSQWLIFYIPLILAGLGYTVALIISYLRNRDKIILVITIGMVFFAFVPLVEYINTQPGVLIYEKLMIIEEMFEKVGATFILGGLVFLTKNNYIKLQKLTKNIE